MELTQTFASINYEHRNDRLLSFKIPGYPENIKMKRHKKPLQKKQENNEKLPEVTLTCQIIYKLTTNQNFPDVKCI